jgi:hypothetical protein
VSPAKDNGALPTPGRLLRDYDADYLVCRNLGHRWVLFGWFTKLGEVHRKLDCERCDAERTDRWTRNGMRLGNRYLYPDGYRAQADAPVTAADVRVEMLRRATVYKSEADMLAAITGGK